MDLNSITLQQILDLIMSPASGGLTATGSLLLIIKFFGKKLFGSLVEDVLEENKKKNKEANEATLDKKIEDKIKNNNDCLKEELLEEIEESLKTHELKMKNENLEFNDNRYLSRQEFKMFIEQQNKVNEKLESSMESIRQRCDQILLKLTNNQ